MKDVENEESANCAYGGGKMSIRALWSDYKSEFVFGIVLSACVMLSNWLADYIPVSVMANMSPILNGCIATVSLFGALLLFRHHKGIHVRMQWACILLVWVVLSVLFLTHVFSYTDPEGAHVMVSLRGWEMAIGNVYAWLLLLYPVAVLRPGWLNTKRALAALLPVGGMLLIDWLTPTDLSLLLALYPVLCVGILATHIRAYRKWCEDNYSSMDDIDVQWIMRYIIMYLLSGAAYWYMCTVYAPAHIFTTQLLVLFMLAYTTEQVLFRQDPWNMVREAARAGRHKTGQQALPEPEEETPSAEDTQEPARTFDPELRATLEKWMEEEKPYTNPDFRLADLRQVLPLNRSYLSQFINAEYGCTFYQFVINYRIAEAKRLISAHPEMKLQDVAAECGFSSAAVFSRTFLKETGVSPSSWNGEKGNA